MHPRLRHLRILVFRRRALGSAVILLSLSALAIQATLGLAGPAFADPPSPVPGSGELPASPAAAAAGPGSEDPAWTEIAREQGVRVERRVVAGRDLPMFRGSGEVEARLADVLAAIEDVDHHPAWMPDCMEARVVRREADALVVYQRTDLPWPASDRDVVLRSQIETLEPDSEVHVYFERLAESGEPAARGAVRMPHLRGHYKIRALGPRRSFVEYQVDADPGGSLPGWIVESATREMPIRTLVGLRQELQRRSLPPVAADNTG